VTALQVLVVDGPAQARSRWRALLAQCEAPAATVAGEAADAVQAMESLGRRHFDLVLLDMCLPGVDGLVLARALRDRPRPHPVVLVSHRAEHAALAFDADVTDFLTWPVQPQRLQQALRKVQRLRDPAAPAPAAGADMLLIPQRDQVLRLPVPEVVYFRAEMKYLTVRTARHSYLLEGSLADLQARLAGQFLRVHRNALVALRCMRALQRAAAGQPQEDRWFLRLDGIQETVAVSRRQLPAVRAWFKEIG
jgi:two-component system response regulator AlgR